MLWHCPITITVLPQMLRFEKKRIKQKIERSAKEIEKERESKREKERNREKRRDNSCPLSCVVTFCASDGVNQSALRSRDIITLNAYLLHDKYVTGTQCSLPFFASLPVRSVLSSRLGERGGRGGATDAVLWAQPYRWWESALRNIKSHTSIYVTYTYTHA